MSTRADRDSSPIAQTDTLLLTRTADGCLVLTDRPGGQRLFAGLFVMAGIIGLFAVASAADRWIAAIGAAVVVMVVSAAIAVVLEDAAASVAILDPSTGRLTLERRHWRRIRTEFATRDIDAWRVVEDADADGDPVVRPAIHLVDGPCVVLSKLWQRDRDMVERMLCAFERQAKGAGAVPP